MSATQTLLQRLRALSGYEHSDFSVGAEAADEIERLQAELAAAPVQPEPVAEAVMDLCQDHQGPVEALAFIPAGTKLYAAQPPREPVQPLSDTVSVCKTDANNYCRILTALGMEEEGDPVAEVERLITERMSAGGKT